MQSLLITHVEATEAETLSQKRNLPVQDVLIRRFGVSQLSVARTHATYAGAQIVNPVTAPPDMSLVFIYGIANCLENGILPWRHIGGATIILTSHPEKFETQRPALQARFGRIRMAITTEEQLARCISYLSGGTLVKTAETTVPSLESCRNWNARRAMFAGVAVLGTIALLGYLAPIGLLAALTVWAAVTLFFGTALKAVAAVVSCRTAQESSQVAVPVRMPVITMLVPLYKETAIAEHLLRRLKALDYPRELLDVCLVLEESDVTTRATLGRTVLPTWMRPVVVPKGTIKTKPRALNYALNFAHGSIIGIWDAEDAPNPDQLSEVAIAFANSGSEVACLQGTLDYYNSSANWLTRCFSLEYASWFRIMLPGLEKLGLVVPLGGTTLFFRRDALENLGGWDAHNVTEDADLGVRLCRHGYRTRLIHTVTEEEANGRAWPWVKQRSRWLKGYAITYGVHMRDPSKLWQDLGPKRFLGVQLLFLGTLSQFVLAPVLWSFWLPVLGVAHPLAPFMHPVLFWTLVALFITSELVGLAMAALGAHKADKMWLLKWAPTLQFYFPLAAIAAYKGLFELASRPFYWDKTAHGVLLPKEWETKATPPLQPLVRPALAE
ncbi:glycosyltransferase family 2 protein [Yoonia sediminilitoris]|uniref:glycosyltransferase family 2 protein n=1 Tax=Yoonia sediminilitoris TaxID=1286148 RepID=UPI001455666F|nr:glycosyltransferase family 2 protein [Yoonia sediminilitoris]